MSDFLTTQQAAEILSIKPISVIQAIKRGYLKAEKFGMQWMLTREEVMRYKRERRVQPKSETDKN